MPNARTRGGGHQRKQEVSSERQEVILYSAVDGALAQVAPGGCGVSHLVGLPTATWMWSWLSGSVCPCLSRGLDSSSGKTNSLLGSLYFCKICRIVA